MCAIVHRASWYLNSSDLFIQSQGSPDEDCIHCGMNQIKLQVPHLPYIYKEESRRRKI